MPNNTVSLIPEDPAISLIPPVDKKPSGAATTSIANAAVVTGMVSDDAVDLSSEIRRSQAITEASGPDVVVKEALGKYSENTVDAIMGQLEGAIATGQKRVSAREAQELEDMRSSFAPALLEAESAQRGDSTQLSNLAIESMSFAGKERTDIVAQDNRAYGVAAEIMDGMDAWDWIVGVADLIFVPDTLKDQLDFLEIVGADPRTSYMDYARTFRNMAPEKRADLLQSVFRGIADADETELKKAIRIHEFIEASETIDDLNKAFDAADWIAYMFPLAKYIKIANTVRKAVAVSNKTVAAELNISAMADPNVAKVLGTDSETALNNIHPVDFEGHIPEAVDGISGEIMSKIEAGIRETEQQINLALSEQKTLKSQFLTPEEEEAQISLWNTELDSLIDSAEDRLGRTIESAERIPKDSRSFEIKYKFAPGSGSGGAKPDFITETVQYTMDDLGNLNMNVIKNVGGKGIGRMEQLVASPSIWANRLFKDVVESSVIMDNQSSIRLETLAPLWREVFEGKSLLNPKGPSKVEQQSLDSVLLQGDETQTNYSLADLRAGVLTPEGTVNLSEDGIVRYYKARSLFEGLHHIKNDEAYRSLQMQGYKAAKISRQIENPEGELVGLEKMALVKPSVPQAGDDTVWVDDLRGLVSRSDPRVQELKSKGYSWYRTDHAVEINNKGDTYDLMLVAPETLDPIPYQVLRPRDGYVPKQRKSEFRFIRVHTPGTKNGRDLSFKEQGGFRTLAVSNSEKSADEWLASEAGQDALRSAGVPEDQLGEAGKEKWWALTEDEGLGVQGTAFGVEKFGGLIGTPRAKHKLIDITGDGRISAHEASERAMRTIAASSTQAEWRLAQQQRWMNSAKDYLKPGASFMDEEPLDIGGKVKRGSSVHLGLMSYRDWLQDVMRVPTKGETIFRSRLEELALRMEQLEVFNAGALKGVRGTMQRYAIQGDPASLLKSVSFHSMLGFWNPAQLMVQASQAALAFSLNPTNAPGIMRRSLALRYGVHLVKGGSSDVALAKIAKAWGIDQGEYVAMIRAFDKSGMRQGITANADFAHALQGNAVDSGTIKRVMNMGLTFFYEGELVGRGYAFINAGMEHSKATGKAWDAFDDSDIIEITRRTLRDTLMMHKNNKASFQKGFVGVPTQFWQVTTKAMEALVPMMFPGQTKRFTRKERGKIVAGQLALYGTAGVAGGNYLSQGAMNMFGVQTGDVGPEQAALINQGLLGLAQQVAFDTQADTSSRMGILSGFEDTVKTFFVDEVPLSEAGLGAFASVLGRMKDAAEAVYAPMVMELSPEFANTVTTTEWQIAADTVASIVSTWRNTSKGRYIEKSGYILGPNGKSLVEAAENDSWLQAIGFTPYKSKEQWSMKADEQARAGYRKDVADALLLRYKKYYNKFDGSLPSMEEQRALKVVQTHLLSTLTGPGERAKVINTLKANMFTVESVALRQQLMTTLLGSEGEIEQAPTSTPVQTRQF